MVGAKEYAGALFSLAEESGRTDIILADVKACAEAMRKNPEYAVLTDTPAISVPEKLSLIDRAFNSVDETVRNLLKILCEKHSVHKFTAIESEFISLYNEARGICRAEAISAVALSAKQMADLTSKLEKLTGKKILLKNLIDTNVLGGIKIRYMGVQMDYTLRSRLTAIEESLQNTIL